MAQDSRENLNKKKAKNYISKHITHFFKTLGSSSQKSSDLSHSDSETSNCIDPMDSKVSAAAEVTAGCNSAAAEHTEEPQLAELVNQRQDCQPRSNSRSFAMKSWIARTHGKETE